MPSSGSTSRIAVEVATSAAAPSGSRRRRRPWRARSSSARAGVAARRDGRGQHPRRIGRVGDDADVDLEAAHLGGVDVDARDLEPGGDRAPARHRHVEPRAEADQQVGVGPKAVAGRRWSGRADGGRRRCPARRGTRPPARRCVSASARISAAACERAAADPDHRRLGARDQFGDGRDLLGVGRRVGRAAAAARAA